jgi:hypothetical protein
MVSNRGGETTAEGWGNRQAKVRFEHRRELATIEYGVGGQWRAEPDTSAGGGECWGRRGGNGFRSMWEQYDYACTRNLPARLRVICAFYPQLCEVAKSKSIPL